MTTQTETHERPILFSTEMIRVILAGRKVQTRRIIKPQPEHQPSLLEHADQHRWSDGFGFIRSCPYGQPGDRLWVRESYLPCRASGSHHPVPIQAATYVCYRDGSQKFREGGAYYQEPPREGPFNWSSEAVWRPSIHMPRWASRITLEITGVRVERLQQISYRDCIVEGMPPVPCYDDGAEPETILRAIRDKYRMLWDSLNAKTAPWESNPWVWCIEFRRLKP